MWRDNSHPLLKYLFGICLCSMLISLSNVLNLLQNGHFPIFSHFGSHFCYHSNGKNRINPRLLHLDYCSNKLKRRNSWKAIFIFWPHKGAKIASCFVRVCLYVLCGHLLGKGWPLGSRLWCLLWVCHFPIGILGQVWYLIVSIPDLCTITYFS